MPVAELVSFRGPVAELGERRDAPSGHGLVGRIVQDVESGLDLPVSWLARQFAFNGEQLTPVRAVRQLADEEPVRRVVPRPEGRQTAAERNHRPVEFSIAGGAAFAGRQRSAQRSFRVIAADVKIEQQGQRLSARPVPAPSFFDHLPSETQRAAVVPHGHVGRLQTAG